MTVSTTAVKDLDINKIVLLAYRESGLISMWQNYDESQRQGALYLLELIVNGLATECRFARTTDERTITLVKDVNSYAMPVDCLDVVGNGKYIDPSQTDITKAVELMVQPIDRERWENITARNATGLPTMYYCHRETDPIEVRLWMTPSSTEAGGTIRFMVHRLRATMTDGNATPDFERYWADYFVAELAHRLALSSFAATDRCAYLKAMAQEKLQRCRGASNESTNQQFIMRHGTGWR
jgi:hypothetical protein